MAGGLLHRAGRIARVVSWRAGKALHTATPDSMVRLQASAASAALRAAAAVSPVVALRHAGCSWSELMRHDAVRAAPMKSAAAVLLCGASAAPLRTAVGVSVLKCTAADAVAQLHVEGNDTLEWRRSAAFALFGATYVGAFQYHLYSAVLKPMHSVATAMLGPVPATVAGVAVDQALITPAMYLPTFYACEAATGRGGGPGLSAGPWEVVRAAAARWREEVVPTMVACWKVWVPAQAFQFLLVPTPLTVPFIAAVGLGWTVQLSAMQAKGRARIASALGAEWEEEAGRHGPEWGAWELATRVQELLEAAGPEVGAPAYVGARRAGLPAPA